MAKNYEIDVQETYCKLGDRGNKKACLFTRTGFGSYRPKLDIREWAINGEGEPPTPCRGIQLSESEAKNLMVALNELFDTKKSQL